ncbi:hypothetical protein BBJ29_002815 [Phytophthora kernoviae]|uniref:Sphingomyelin synthase-like domain-containing protein n=1 Tax=Phytophthora kernoviae TaxID=325452 RepID=A0A3F2RQR9_9STRA|nr:hypothetical protein BBJ29_002815 [Phytophthora kernoviae]RLN61995.1 hypothetical protein BBP00_00005042 [Phytophthora kernoviae]
MTSYLPFAQSNVFRTKRKLSGPVGSWGPGLDEKNPASWPELDGSPIQVEGGRSVHHWCDSVDYREILGFVLFAAFMVADVGLGVMVWVTFFKFIVEPDEHRSKATWGGIWLAFAFTFFYVRRLVRSRTDVYMRGMMDHAEIYVAMSLVMVFSVNIAFYLHVPTTTPLKDLGFMLIPEQGLHSMWRPVSDILTAGVPVLFLLQTVFMTRPNRCRIVSSFFRYVTICYFLRMLTVSVTSLPGPAPHCRAGSPDYFPPTTWIDIITRVGPIYGNYNSCGDLIFSGHMCFTNSAVLLYLRTMDRNFPGRATSKIRWSCGMAYVMVLAVLCIAGRKHYTVDMVLGWIISTLVFFHFEHSWTPLCFQVPQGLLPLADLQRIYGSQWRKRFSMDVTDEAVNELDDNVGEEESRRLLKTNASSYNQPKPKFSSRNLSAVFKTPLRTKPLPDNATGPLPRTNNRLLVLGRATTAPPAPINTPSMLKESQTHDAPVSFVPAASNWATNAAVLTETNPPQDQKEKEIVAVVDHGTKPADPAVPSSVADKAWTPESVAEHLHTTLVVRPPVIVESSGRWGDDEVENDIVQSNFRRQRQKERDFPNLKEAAEETHGHNGHSPAAEHVSPSMHSQPSQQHYGRATGRWAHFNEQEEMYHPRSNWSRDSYSRDKGDGLSRDHYARDEDNRWSCDHFSQRDESGGWSRDRYSRDTDGYGRMSLPTHRSSAAQRGQLS